VKAGPVTVRRLGIGLAVAAALLSSACAAGQHAQTADEKATLDGTDVSIGSIDLRALAVEPPVTNDYAPGSSPALKLVIVNSGATDDRLTGITSPLIGGWGAFTSKSAAAAAANPDPAATSAPRPIHSVTIPHGSRVSWGTPGAAGSLLLLDTKQTIYPGTDISLTFSFANAGTKTFSVPVQLTNGISNPSYIPAPPSDSGGTSDFG
jgi:copper(I)-binding protein